MSLLSNIQGLQGGGLLSPTSPRGGGVSYMPIAFGGAPASSANAARMRAVALMKKAEEDDGEPIITADEVGDMGTTEPQGATTYPLEPQGGSVPKDDYAQEIKTGIDAAVDKYASQGDIPAEDVPLVKGLVYTIAELESGWGKNTRGQEIGTEVSGDMAHAGDRAMGPFQFMTSTAQAYGLKDRMDPYESADATIRHLITAYKHQGDWRKAAIGHHSGPAYKSLGKWGQDFAQKLDNRLPRYYS